MRIQCKDAMTGLNRSSSEVEMHGEEVKRPLLNPPQSGGLEENRPCVTPSDVARNVFFARLCRRRWDVGTNFVRSKSIVLFSSKFIHCPKKKLRNNSDSKLIKI